MDVSRRRFLIGAGAASAVVLTATACARPATASPDVEYEVTHTDAEWQQLLTGDQYNVLRQAGTEVPYTSPLNDEHRPGIFSCAGCAQELFSSETKFDSGTGWPSFWQPLDGAVVEDADSSTRYDAHGGALPTLRWSPRPCVRRRSATHRPSLLHERRRDDLPAGLTVDRVELPAPKGKQPGGGSAGCLPASGCAAG